MRNYSYVSYLYGDAYIEGVINLNKRLISLKSKYPFFVVVSQVSSLGIKKLESSGVHWISSQFYIKDLEESDYGCFERWKKTLGKIEIFSLFNYDKLVYLDADLFINRNIDELFEKSHMSAVNAGTLKDYDDDFLGLNSGLMVIVPQMNLAEEILSYRRKIQESKSFYGDQDLINAYYHDWFYSKNLVLPQSYNMFPSLIDEWVKLNNTKVKVVHYIGEIKPWMMNFLQVISSALRLLIKNKKYQAFYLIKYYLNIMS